MRFTSLRPLWALAGLLTAAQAMAADLPLLRDRTEANRPTLMLLGTPHFANYNRDIVNTQVPDILSPQRQAEIAKVAQALAAFKPTKVAVEIAAKGQDKLSATYRAYVAGSHKLQSDEYQQLGMRIAAAAGHADIYAVDWNEMPPGKIEDIDYDEWATKNGKAALLDQIRLNPAVAEYNRQLPHTTVAQWLLKYNQPEALADSHRRYFDYAMLGNSEQQPGANWLASWYGRNLKIFSKLVALAPQPGDRILVIYGAGHIPLLREYALQSGAFNLADPQPLLQQAR
ncbi:DUF5694 domain-containing protein [Massilia endophytica]|uniref:DUF5694 domain-containing protein n=1 Tax=Massilia endophytica TaxID=2899220 RepID=UPI001E2DEE39|nr:DUF5694 domain-containing protein [Massilia endophytica]UGQ44866.1 DUF5694 domain-containing protein [Massilia endophytica]